MQRARTRQTAKCIAAVPALFDRVATRTGALHAPHHVPKEYIDRYRGKFDQGWDALREETFARQKNMGVVPQTADLTPRPKERCVFLKA